MGALYSQPALFFTCVFQDLTKLNAMQITQSLFILNKLKALRMSMISYMILKILSVRRI
jgi:hypothetical protein